MIVAGTPRGLPPPSPVATAMYCLPSTSKLIGNPCTDVASLVSHTTRPSLTSTALKPARVKATAGKGGDGILRIDFGEPEASLETISWDDFFATFDENDLAFLYQDRTSDGKTSRFFKFVHRESR